MSTLSNVRFWNDCGFTEGCIEVPDSTRSLPVPDYVVSETQAPNTTDMFSKLNLKVPYETLMNASYMSVDVSWNNAQDQTFYGWIDSVVVHSDTQGYPSTDVYWHVDLWRTYLAQAQFGYGMVMRRPLAESDSVPPQPYPHRYEVPGTRLKICGDNSTWWVFINVSQSGGQGATINYAMTYAVPVNLDNPTTAYSISAAGTGGITVPFQDFVNGKWDEDLGLVPENVKSVFLSPIPPTTATVSGNTVSMGWGAMKPDNGTAWVFTVSGVRTAYSETAIPFTTPRMSDDNTHYVITGFDGEVVGELPWGIEVNMLYMRVVMASTSAYIQIRTGIEGHVQGTAYTVPLIAVELSQNSWSSYAYSGARQADINQRALDARAQRDSAILNAGIGAGNNVVGGLIGGAMMGNPLLGIGMGIANTAMAAVGAQANYRFQQKVNDQQQGIADYRAASQPNGLVMSGSGFDTIVHGNRGISVVEVKNDEYSTGIRNKDIELFGAHVCEPTEDCSALISAGGGLQISNLIVKGDIPVEAKAYIKERLAGGVRII